VQDVFIKLWEKNVEISSSTTIKAFLYMAVKNACLNHIRDNKKDDLNISDIDENDLEMEQKNDWIEEDFIYNLYKAIEDLSPRSKQAVMMTVMEYSNQEIAEQMNVSVNTIKTIKYRSYKRLRENLISLASFLFFLH
jgi:RNA polymerase sigma-70 factor (ECF subfamily)